MKQQGLSIVAHSSFFFFFKKKKTSSLYFSFFLCPPNNMIVSGDIILHFNFFPTDSGKNCKTGAWNQKVMQSFVCALEGNGEQWTEKKQKPIVLLWSAAKPPRLLLLLVPQGVCFSSFLWQKSKKIKMYWEMGEKMILFSPILATYDIQRWKHAIDFLKNLIWKRFSYVIAVSSKYRTTSVLWC